MAATNSQNRCVFVGNIPYGSTEEQIKQICEEVGPVVSFRLVIDKDTGKPKGYGFCEYKDEETAASARRNLQGYELNGRQLRVNFSVNDYKAGSDRNRGGPGLSVDPQTQIGGPAIIGDPALHHPVGMSLASTAASVMAGALGNYQNGATFQNGLCNDPLTHYLATMSKHRMFEVMSEFKVLATQDKELARQLLLSSPQLAKALFQAQIMLGMVTPQPQVLQMPNMRQSPGSFVQPPSQPNFQPSSSNPLMRPSVPKPVNFQPAEQSALLEQLMNLTPEQLSSLTFEQQQQVIQLQAELRSV